VTERVLTERELNRTLLERQLLLRRHRLPVARAIERLGGLQAQWPNSPYIALWSRLESFDRAQLTGALKRRSVVKATLMRLTLHMVSARDFVGFSGALRDARLERFERELAKHAPGVDAAGITARAVKALGDSPRLRKEYFELLGEDEGSPANVMRPWLLWVGIQTHGELVHAPPSGLWNHYGSAPYIPAQNWLRRMPKLNGDARVYLIRRYLAAFGPASTADLNSWSHARGLRPALEALEPELRRFRDENGRLLFDLRRAPLVDGDAPSPVRFLPKWDTSILGYAPPERWRILPERHRKTVIKVNGDVAQTFLVDGFVAGTWEVERRGKSATLKLSPFGRLARDVRDELTQEGERLLRFFAPDAGSYSVR
jgi:hypothetical protein